MATKKSNERCPLTIIWRIENLGLFGKYDTERVRSPILRPRTFGGKKFIMNFRPKGKHSDDKWVSLGLAQPGEVSSFLIDCKWSFVGVRGSDLIGGTVQNQVLSEKAFYFPNCPTHKEVFVTRKSEFFHHDTLTVQYRIWMSEEYLPNHEFISCRTRLETLEHSFLWPISRFSTLKLKEEVTTPITFGDSRSKDNFLMKFSLKGESLDDSTANMELVPISVFQSCIATLKLSVLNIHQNAWKYGESMPASFFEGNNTTMEFPAFVSRKEVLDKRMNYLRHDALTLRCEIPIVFFTTKVEKSCHDLPNIELGISKDISTHLSLTTEHKVDLDEISLQEKISLNILADDFLSMYQDENWTDFRLCSGEISFPVHKIILSARSPVFKAMFSTNMQESGSDSLDIPDLDSHTLNRLLTFLYSGTVVPDLDMQNATKLFYAADKYQVQSLKQHCSCILRSYLSVSTVSDILTLADKHQDQELTSFVHDFFLRHFDSIVQSEEWGRFMGKDPALAGRTVIQLYKKKLQLKLP